MAYIGKQPAIGNFVKLDAISVVNGQASYTMQNGGANFTEYSNVNQFLVSLNGILQSPTDSFTVSGSTITFASNLITGDVIDFIIVLGNSLDVGVPSDNTVSLAKLTATGTKDATTFLRGDNTFATVTSGLTEADQWRLTANQSANTNAVISSNLERVDTDGFGLLGTGLTNSSGVFSFPSTGYYLIMYTALITAGSNHNEARVILETTTDNSTYDDAVQIGAGDGSGGTTNYSVHGQFIFDVTDTSTHKFRLVTEAMSSSYVNGDTARNQTHFTVIKLGDT
jgi:hypothetical protein